MADLITATTFTERTGRTLTATQATQVDGLITDASALVADIVDDATITDTWDAATPGTVPDSVVPVVVAMVRRGLDNPDGFASESLGSYTYRHVRDAAQSGVFATRDEAKVIRRAAGTSSVGALNLDSHMLHGPVAWLDGAL